MVENPFLDAEPRAWVFDELKDLDDKWLLKSCRKVFPPRGFIKVGVTHDPAWFEFSTVWNGKYKAVVFSHGAILRYILSADYGSFRTEVENALGIDPALLGKTKRWQTQSPLAYYQGLKEKKRQAANSSSRRWHYKHLPSFTKEK